MSVTTYHVLHVSSILVLLAYTFYAFAAPPETRKRVLAISGIAALVALVTGFGLLHKLDFGFPKWAMVKLVCLLGLGAMTGLAYRRRQHAGSLMLVALVLAIVAVVMVYAKPF